MKGQLLQTALWGPHLIGSQLITFGEVQHLPIKCSIFIVHIFFYTAPFVPYFSLFLFRSFSVLFFQLSPVQSSEFLLFFFLHASLYFFSFLHLFMCNLLAAVGTAES